GPALSRTGHPGEPLALALSPPVGPGLVPARGVGARGPRVPGVTPAGADQLLVAKPAGPVLPGPGPRWGGAGGVRDAAAADPRGPARTAAGLVRGTVAAAGTGPLIAWKIVRLVVEQLQLAGRARHEEIDDG